MIYLHQGDCRKVIPKLPRGFDLVVADPPADFEHTAIVEVLRLCRLKAASEAHLFFYGRTKSLLSQLLREAGWNWWSDLPIYHGKHVVGWVCIGYKTALPLNHMFPHRIFVTNPKGFLPGLYSSKTRDWYEYLIRPMGYHNVLDPFAGLGAVGEICSDMGSHYTAIEQDIETFRRLRRRIT